MGIPIKTLCLFFLSVQLCFADVALKDQNSSTGAEINSNNALETVRGRSSKATYIASISGQTTTAAYTLSIESAAGTGFRLLSWCAGVTNATAAAGVTVIVQRRTSASSGGVALTNEGTGATVISKMDPADSDYGGVARATATLGGAGAVLDQHGFQIGELGAGTADPPGIAPFCVNYDDSSGKTPVIASGTSNGVSISVSSLGAGGLAFGSISARIVAE